MKKTKLALAITAATFVATPVLATNGTNMVGLGAQSSALGGTGVAAYYGAENVVVNPGLIGKATGSEFAFGGTVFMPSVSSDNGAGAKDSSANMNLIPSVSLVSRISDSMTFGIGMYGTSGMGVDYSKHASLMEAQSNMQIMRFVPTLAFNQDNFGVGFSPIIQYGSLDIHFYNQADSKYYGKGMASDLGYGFSLGGYFDITKELTLAAAYTSSIEMKYDGQLSTASGPFPVTFADKLAQPAELKVGAAYTMGNMLYTADVKQIAWGSAKGYKDFGWQDQNVIAVGAKYSQKNYWAGVGLNHGNNPIKKQNGATMAGAAINMFNNIFFPATTETHVTLGGGYSLTSHLTLEGAIVYAPEVKTSVTDTSGMGLGTNTTTHSQMGYTVTARYNF